MRAKMTSVRDHHYIGKGHMRNLTHVFSVPKADGDIRLVYDCTRLLVNDALWAPTLALLMIEVVLQPGNGIQHNCANLDLSEMFLIFTLQKSLQAFCGVDLTPYFPEDRKEGCQTLWEQWTRCLMGLKLLPYQTIRAFILAEEIIRGHHCDVSNVFQWERVRLNLPGSREYDPHLLWVSKVRLAADFFTYMDDISCFRWIKVRMLDSSPEGGTAGSVPGNQGCSKKASAQTSSQGHGLDPSFMHSMRA
jgi:hypothetical protein